MRKYLSILACLLLYPSMAFATGTEAYSSFITNATTVGASIPSGGLFAVTTGGATYSATAAQVAAMGGSSLPAYPVTGLTCDAGLVPLGVVATNGSPTLTLANTNNNYPTSFPYAKAGDTIVLSSPSQANSSTNPTTNFTSTILSATTTSVTMTSNATFTSTNYQYAQAFYYGTDNFTAIQTALTNANFLYPSGAALYFPPGGCAMHGPATFYTGQHFIGNAVMGTMLAQTNGSNSDLFVSKGFSTYTTTGSFGGVVGNTWEHIYFFMNKAENTGSGVGSNTGTGAAIRMYGYGFDLRDVIFDSSPADALYTEWSGGMGGGDPLNSRLSETWFMTGPVQFTNNNGWGWDDAGPHDLGVTNITATNNSNASLSLTTTNFQIIGGGVLINGSISNASPTPFILSNSHFYENGPGYDLNCVVGCTLNNVYLEGNVLFRQESSAYPSYQISNSKLSGTFYLGANSSDCGGNGVNKMLISNTEVANLNNSSGCGTGFLDSWAASRIAAFTGSYIPYRSLGVLGLSNYMSSFGESTAFLNGSSWPAALQTNNVAGGTFSITDGVNIGGAGVAFAINANGNVAIGPTGIAPASIGQPHNALDLYGGLGLITTTATLPVNGVYSPVANSLAVVTSGAASVEVTHQSVI